MTNTLYFGDNLHVLRDHVASESVDLVYLDPPFNSNANYNILFRSPEGQQSESQIEAFEVKGGGTGVKDVGRLAQVMDREGAKIGVLITAQPPTRAMERDAAAVGVWENEYTGRKHARLQIITLAELFQNKRPDIAWVDLSIGKKAKREETSKQGSLL